jgi:hypothetical protein
MPLVVFNMDAKPPFSKFHLKISGHRITNESRETFNGSDVLLAHSDEQTILICRSLFLMDCIYMLKSHDFIVFPN